MEKYLTLLFRWRWLVVAVTIVLVATTASGILRLTFTSDYRVYFSNEDPHLQALNNLHDTYTRDDTILFIVTSKERSIFTEKTLSEIQWLTEQAWEIAYTQRVDSITNFQFSRGKKDELIVHDLIEEIHSFDDSELERMRSIALNEPLLRNRLIANSTKVAGVLVTVQFPGEDELREIPEAANDARQLAQELRDRDPNLEVRLTGGVMIGNAFPEASKQDISTLFPIMFLVVFLVLGFSLRSISATFCALLVIVFSILCTMGAAGWLGIQLSPPSASAPNIILTIAVADCIHILVSFLQAMRSGWINNLSWRSQCRLGIEKSLNINLHPVFLTSLTTAVGFLSLNFSESPPFHDLGNIVALGVGFAFVLSIVFLPALLTLLPMGVRREKTKENKAIEALSTFIITNKKPLLFLMSVIVIALVSNVSRNELSDDPVKYFSKETVFRTDTEYAIEHLAGMYVMEYSIQAKGPGGITNPEYLKVLNEFARWYRSQPETLHVYSIADIIKRLNKNMHGDDPNWEQIPDDRELAAQYLLLYEMSLPEGLDLNDRINIDKSASRFTASVISLSSKELLELERRAVEWIQKNAPDVKFNNVTGPNMMFAHVNQKNIRSIVQGTIIALGLISLVLVITLKSIPIGALSLLPNIIPAAMAFGFWGLINGQINLALSVVATMTLGIVVDDTVHFLTKYLFARRNKGLDQVAAIRYTFLHVGNALWITSIVLVSGFLILTLSDFELNAQLGLMVAITIIFALVADFFLLPPLLLLFDSRQSAQ